MYYDNLRTTDEVGLSYDSVGRMPDHRMLCGVFLSLFLKKMISLLHYARIYMSLNRSLLCENFQKKIPQGVGSAKLYCILDLNVS